MRAALFVDPKGCYSLVPSVDIWDERRDARKYDGPFPVVAHPPCHLWTNLARLNFQRWGGEHNRPGNDGGCFQAALNSVRMWGGVLEHPAFSHAWRAFGLRTPRPGTWTPHDWYWVCEVWQSAYGHKCRKRTWLLYAGKNAPTPMRWERPTGSAQIGGFDRIKPVLSGRAASATPPEFRDALLALVDNSADLA